MRGWQWVMGAGVLGIGVVLCPWPTSPGNPQTVGEMISLLVTRQRPDVSTAASAKSPPVLAAAVPVLQSGAPWAPFSPGQPSWLIGRGTDGVQDENASGAAGGLGALGWLGHPEGGTGSVTFIGTSRTFGRFGSDFAYNPLPGSRSTAAPSLSSSKGTPASVPAESGASEENARSGDAGGPAYHATTNPWPFPRSSGGSHRSSVPAPPAPPRPSVPEQPKPAQPPVPTVPDGSVNPPKSVPISEPPTVINPPVAVITLPALPGVPALPKLPVLPDLPTLPGIPEIGKPESGGKTGPSVPRLEPGALIDSLFGQVFGALVPEKNAELFPMLPFDPTTQSPADVPRQKAEAPIPGGLLSRLEQFQVPAPGDGANRSPVSPVGDVRQWTEEIFTGLSNGFGKNPGLVPQLGPGGQAKNGVQGADAGQSYDRQAARSIDRTSRPRQEYESAIKGFAVPVAPAQPQKSSWRDSWFGTFDMPKTVANPDAAASKVSGDKPQSPWGPPSLFGSGREWMGRAEARGDQGNGSSEPSQNPASWGTAGSSRSASSVAQTPGAFVGNTSRDRGGVSTGHTGPAHSETRSTPASVGGDSSAVRGTSWGSPAARSSASPQSSADAHPSSGGTSVSSSSSTASAGSASSRSGGLGGTISHLLSSLAKSLSLP